MMLVSNFEKPAFGIYLAVLVVRASEIKAIVIFPAGKSFKNDQVNSNMY